MDKQDFFDIYNKSKRGQILLMDDVIKHMNERGTLTSFIVDELLPTVKDNEKFIIAFRDWMEKYYIELYNAMKLILLKYDIEMTLLLHYQLKFCQKIFGESK